MTPQQRYLKPRSCRTVLRGFSRSLVLIVYLQDVQHVLP